MELINEDDGTHHPPSPNLRMANDPRMPIGDPILAGLDVVVADQHESSVLLQVVVLGIRIEMGGQ